MNSKVPYKPPFIFKNLGDHMTRNFDLWTIKNPSPATQAQRLLIFFSALLATVYWPITNLFIEFILLILVWIMLSLYQKPILRWLLMLNLMLNIAWLYLLMQYFLFLIS